MWSVIHGRVSSRLVGLAAVVVASLAMVACGGAAMAPSPTVAPAASVQASLSLEVSVADAAALRDAGALVIDVREPSEWTAGHIAGATLIPLGELATRLGEVPHDRTVVVVCRTGHRSAQGRDLLRQAGYENVVSMAGGLNAWTASGMPIVTGS
jgi:rhodanese-related sulfurtransferase